MLRKPSWMGRVGVERRRCWVQSLVWRRATGSSMISLSTLARRPATTSLELAVASPHPAVGVSRRTCAACCWATVGSERRICQPVVTALGSPVVASDDRPEVVAGEVDSPAPYPTCAARSLIGHISTGPVAQPSAPALPAGLSTRPSPAGRSAFGSQVHRIRMVNGNSGVSVRSHCSVQRLVACRGSSRSSRAKGSPRSSRATGTQRSARARLVTRPNSRPRRFVSRACHAILHSRSPAAKGQHNTRCTRTPPRLTSALESMRTNQQRGAPPTGLPHRGDAGELHRWALEPFDPAK